MKIMDFLKEEITEEVNGMEEGIVECEGLVDDMLKKWDKGTAFDRIKLTIDTKMANISLTMMKINPLADELGKRYNKKRDFKYVKETHGKVTNLIERLDVLKDKVGSIIKK